MQAVRDYIRANLAGCVADLYNRNYSGSTAADAYHYHNVVRILALSGYNGTDADQMALRMITDAAVNHAHLSLQRRSAVDDAAFVCEDMARTNELTAMRSEDDDLPAGTAQWYRDRAKVLREAANRIRNG